MRGTGLLVCWLFLFLLTAICRGKPLTEEELFRAGARFDGPGVCGSGACMGVTPGGDKLVYLGNHHVVRNAQSNEVVAIVDGKEYKATGRRVWSAFKQGQSVDLSILLVDRGSWRDSVTGETKKLELNSLPFLPYDYKIKPGDKIRWIGCPKCVHPSINHGHVTESQRSLISFLPTAIGGMSGSGVAVDADPDGDGEFDTYYAFCLTWYYTSARGRREGLGQSHTQILDELSGRTSTDEPLPAGAMPAIDLDERVTYLPTSAVPCSEENEMVKPEESELPPPQITAWQELATTTESAPDFLGKQNFGQIEEFHESESDQIADKESGPATLEVLLWGVLIGMFGVLVVQRLIPPKPFKVAT